MAASNETASVLDRLIRPEIRNDRFSRAIVEIAATPGVREILEIGSSSGEGSTEAWVSGALRQADPPRLHCIEVSIGRHAALAERWRDHPFVHAYNVSSVPLESFPSPDEIRRFHRDVRSKLRKVPIDTLLEWLRIDLDYVRDHDLSRHGIREIRDAAGVGQFDAVLIDGSEFTGRPELEEVYGARFLLLDDAYTYKNWENRLRLDADPAYRRVAHSRWTRNGFAAYERVDAAGA
jgi:hypothetical protein